jgi:hypothetical protein
MPQDNSKTLTPTAALDQAMLGLTRVGTPFLNEDEVSLMPSEETATEAPQSHRDGIMDEVLAERPGLTREKLSKAMSEMGF